jgi:predicted RNA-binding Zn-ribbon protein involved in translation (DUF1610 family)
MTIIDIQTDWRSHAETKCPFCEEGIIRKYRKCWGSVRGRTKCNNCGFDIKMISYKREDAVDRIFKGTHTQKDISYLRGLSG